MEQKRFATQNFYMEAVVDGDRIVSLVGCSAEVEMVELDHLRVTTAKNQMYYKLGDEINWLMEDTDVIPGMENLLDDYDMYRTNVGDGYIPSPRAYLDAYEESMNTLPAPLKHYFLELFKETGYSPVSFSIPTKLHLSVLQNVFGEFHATYGEDEYNFMAKAFDTTSEAVRKAFQEILEVLQDIDESEMIIELPKE